MSKTTIADLPPHVYVQADLAKSLAEESQRNTLDLPRVAKTARYDTGRALLKSSHKFFPNFSSSWSSFEPPISHINPFVSGDFQRLRQLLQKTLQHTKKKRKKNKQKSSLHLLYETLDWAEKEMEAIHYHMAGSQKG